MWYLQLNLSFKKRYQLIQDNQLRLSEIMFLESLAGENKQQSINTF
jgi:hypothetical protein